MVGHAAVLGATIDDYSRDLFRNLSHPGGNTQTGTVFAASLVCVAGGVASDQPGHGAGDLGGKVLFLVRDVAACVLLRRGSVFGRQVASRHDHNQEVHDHEFKIFGTA